MRKIRRALKRALTAELDGGRINNFKRAAFSVEYLSAVMLSIVRKRERMQFK